MTREAFNVDPPAAVSAPDLFDPDEVLTTLEVAERLKFKTAKVIRGAIKRRELRASRIGSEYRISGENANAYWRRQEEGCAAPEVRAASTPATAGRVAPARRARRQPILGQGR